MRRLAGYLWAAPNTFVGIAIGLILAGRFRWVDGVIEISSPGIHRALLSLVIPAQALTLGHVVLGQDETALDITRYHERVHVQQYERWGPLFVPAYLLFSTVLYACGRDGYRENPFEIEAYAESDES